MKNALRTYAMGIALISCLAMVFQISLSRVLSVTLWYHFAFLVVSLAMLGFVASAIICFAHWDKIIAQSCEKYLSLFSGMFAVLAPLSIFIHLNLNFINVPFFSLKFIYILTVQLLFFTSVFFAAGMCVNIILFKSQDHIGLIYFFDLLGSAAGGCLAIYLLFHLNPMSIVFLLFFSGLLMAWAFQPMALGRYLILLLLVAGWLAFFYNNGKFFTIRAVKNYARASFQRATHKTIFEEWSPFGLISISQRGLIPGSPGKLFWIENDAAAYSPLKKFHPDYWNKEHYERSHLSSHDSVYLLKNNADVLIIGSGGGDQVLTALVFKANQITAVELNPVTAKIVTDYFAGYIGHIFQYPQVKFLNQEGRNYTARTKDRYDIIQLFAVDSWSCQNSAYIFNENNLYTKEAINDYVTHLRTNGILSLSRWYSNDEALRIANTILAYLEEKGFKDIEKKMVVLRDPRKYYYLSATVLLKNGDFSRDEINKLLSYLSQGPAGTHRGEIIYAPYLPESQMDQNSRAVFFRTLVQSARGLGGSRKKLAKSYPRNIEPATDDRPFFFFMTKFKDSFNFSDNDPRRFAIPLLYSLFILISAASMALMMWPLYLYKKKAAFAGAPLKASSLVYFAAIGLGFLFIELSLISRFTIFLGQQIFAFVVVLSSLLLSAGCGSLISSRIRPSRLRVIISLIVACGLWIGLSLYDRLNQLMGLTLMRRILLCVSILAPLGILMGMCLPLGVRLVQKFDQRLIAWAWGVNGIFSILASVSSIVLALHFGLKAVFLTGVGCYFFGWLVSVGIIDAHCKGENL